MDGLELREKPLKNISSSVMVSWAVQVPQALLNVKKHFAPSIPQGQVFNLNVALMTNEQLWVT